MIREANETDAEALLELQRALDTETPMMMLEEGERTTTLDEMRCLLRACVAASNSTILVAESDEELVAYLEVEGGGYRRTRHSAYVVMGVRRTWPVMRSMPRIIERCWSDSRRAFVQHEGSEVLDASVLLMPLVKFVAGDDPRWLSTLDAIT